MVFFLFLLLLHTANACSTNEELRLRGIEPPEDNRLPEGCCSPDEFHSYKLISEEKHNELRRRVGKAAKKYSVGCSINKGCIWWGARVAWENGGGWEKGAGWKKTGVRGRATDEDCLSKDCIRNRRIFLLTWFLYE